MSKPNMTAAELKKTADAIRNAENRMHEAKLDMQQRINWLEQHWVSPEGDEIRSRFLAYCNRYESERETILNYAEFLELTSIWMVGKENRNYDND